MKYPRCRSRARIRNIKLRCSLNARHNGKHVALKYDGVNRATWVKDHGIVLSTMIGISK